MFSPMRCGMVTRAGSPEVGGDLRPQGGERGGGDASGAYDPTGTRCAHPFE